MSKDYVPTFRIQGQTFVLLTDFEYYKAAFEKTTEQLEVFTKGDMASMASRMLELFEDRRRVIQENTRLRELLEDYDGE